MSALEVARRFVERINAHDPDGLAALLTTDHRFIDSLGGESGGVQTLRDAWRQYFRIVPDFQVEVVRAFVDEPEVILVGTARGTYTRNGQLEPSNAWSTPAAWRARIHADLVAEWQIYADNEPIRRCMARASA